MISINEKYIFDSWHLRIGIRKKLSPSRDFIIWCSKIRDKLEDLLILYIRIKRVNPRSKLDCIAATRIVNSFRFSHKLSTMFLFSCYTT